MMMKNNYDEIIEYVRKGESLTSISKRLNIDRRNIRKQLKKRFPDEYDSLIYGEVVDIVNGKELRKIPQNKTNKKECDMTKIAKKILIDRYDCIEEVGVWNKKRNKRYTADLYSKKNKLAIEIYWRSSETSKELIRKLFKYKELYGEVLLVLLKNSEYKKKNRTYPYLKEKTRKAGFKYIILDTPPM